MDLEQVILESSGAAVMAVEIALSLATDTAENTWLERLPELSANQIAK